ncbi:MAG: flippase [Candidatus Staskawiczbacteria bacterium]
MSYKKFTQDIGILGLVQLLNILSGLIVLPVITKILGAENYGVWTQITVTSGLISSIAVLGLPFALVRFLAGEKDKKEIQDGVWSVFTLIFCITIVISSILIFFSAPISKFFGCDKIFIPILGLIIIFGCLNQLFLNIFRTFQEIKKLSFLNIVAGLGESGLAILAIFLGYRLLGAILSLLIVQIIMFLIMGALIVKRVGIAVPKFLKIKEYLLFSLPAEISEIFLWVVQSSDKYFIGFFLGTIFVGYYAPAYTLGCVLFYFLGPVMFLLPAILAKHHDENEIEKVKNYLKYSLKYFLMLAMPSVFGLSILSKQLLTIFSTAEIAQQSYNVVPLVALSFLLLGFCTIADQIIGLKKKTKISGGIWFIAAFLNFGLNFIFVPRFGIFGAAVTTLLAYACATALTWYYAMKEIQFEVDWQFILKSIFASFLMGLFIIWIKPIGFRSVITVITLSVLIYAILIFLLKSFEKKELEFVKTFFKGD